MRSGTGIKLMKREREGVTGVRESRNTKMEGEKVKVEM